MLYSEKFCIECNYPVHGRSDKKFCSDACRTAYHNKVRVEAQPAIREVNRILFRNRSILMNCSSRRNKILTEDYLLARGFNFNYFTHICSGPEGQASVFCYEIGYTRRDENSISLVKDVQMIGYRSKL